MNSLPLARFGGLVCGLLIWVRDEWERSKHIARGMGYTFFGVGLLLLFLIIYAMATRFGQ